MREWLPSAMLVVLAVLALVITGAAAWRRTDPRHEFIVSLLSGLSDQGGFTKTFASGRKDTIGSGFGAGQHHRAGRAHV